MGSVKSANLVSKKRERSFLHIYLITAPEWNRFTL
jgi:hypothetical protein